MELELLVQRFQKKDIRSFEQLYGMYSKNICGDISSIVRDREIAEELGLALPQWLIRQAG